MKFKIDRDTWARGGEGDTRLLNKEGRRCCLGFFLKACGVGDEYMVDIAEPTNVDVPLDTFPEQAKFLVDVRDDEDEFVGPDASVYSSTSGSDECDTLIHLNDKLYDDEKGREEAIAKTFAENGHEVTFVGTLPPKPTGSTVS